MFPALHITKGSVREMLSIPFQQTARYVQGYGETLEEEDETNIRTVLGAGHLTLKEIGDTYVPDWADDVKGRFNRRSTGTDLKNYFKTWGRGLTQHPTVYIEAFLNMNYGWFAFDSNHGMHHYSGITGKNIDKMLEDVEICFLVMLIRKKCQELVACCIIYANYLICFAGPVAYARYALPMIVCAPFVLVLTFAKERD